MGLERIPDEVAQVARAAAGIVRRVLADPDYRVLLFGSWASGSAGERSDIDLGIAGPAPLDASVLYEIREGIDELATLYTVDVVDLQQVGQEFRSAVLTGAIEVEGAA